MRTRDTKAVHNIGTTVKPSSMITLGSRLASMNLPHCSLLSWYLRKESMLYPSTFHLRSFRDNFYMKVVVDGTVAVTIDDKQISLHSTRRRA